MSKHRISRRFLYLLLFIPVCCLVFVFINFFRLKKVYFISPKKVESGLEIFNGKNLLWFDVKIINQHLLDRNPEIKSMLIAKSYPSSLVIDLMFREPVAIVAGEGDNFFIDTDGRLLPYDENLKKDLPEIRLAGAKLYLTNNTDWRIINALTFLKQSKIQGVDLSNILIDKDKPLMMAYLPEGTEVIIPQTGNFANLAASLQIIVSRFRIEGKFITKVDFQFDKPIVLLENDKNISSNTSH